MTIMCKYGSETNNTGIEVSAFLFFLEGDVIVFKRILVSACCLFLLLLSGSTARGAAATIKWGGGAGSWSDTTKWINADNTPAGRIPLATEKVNLEGEGAVITVDAPGAVSNILQGPGLLQNNTLSIVSGGVFSTNALMTFGYLRTGTFNVSGGDATVVGGMRITGGTIGTGILDVSGGKLTLGALVAPFNNNGNTATINLTGTGEIHITDMGTISIGLNGPLVNFDIRDNGKLTAAGDRTLTLQPPIAVGYITAYGGDPRATLNLSYDNVNNVTSLSASIGDLALAYSPQPGHNADVNKYEISTLGWQPGDNVGVTNGHEVYFGTDEMAVTQADINDVNGIYKGAQSTTTWAIDVNLVLDQTYYWRIDEVNDANGDRWKGTVWNFRVLGSLLAPANGASVTLPNQYFQWIPSITPDVTAMGSYIIEIASDSNFATIVDEDKIAATISWYVPNMLFDYGTTYYWRVTPVDANGIAGIPTPVWSFSIIGEPTVYNVNLGTSFSSMKSIIATAAANTPAIVRFAQGTHTFDPGTDADFINLVGVSDLVIEGAGSGANIVSQKRVSFLRTEGCNRILFNNITFDIVPRFYSAGTVLSKDIPNSQIDIEIVPAHPLLGSETYLDSIDIFYVMQGNPPRVSTDASSVSFGFTKQYLGNSQYRLTLTNPSQMSEINVGDVTVFEGSRFGFCWAINSEDIVYYKIIAYSAGNGFVAKYGDRMRILSSGYTLKPGRYITCVAGAGNFHDCRLGPWTEGCWIANVADDGQNANSTVRGVYQQIDSNTLDLHRMTIAPETPSDPQKVFAPGDIVMILNPNDGNYIERTVVSSSLISDGGNTYYRVIFDNDVGSIYPGNTNQDATATRITNLNRNSPGYAQRFNTYQYVQRNALIVSSTGGLIEGCTIVGCGNRAVDSSGPYTPQSMLATNLVIRDIYIEDAARLNTTTTPVVPILFRKIGLGAMNGQGMDYHKNILLDRISFANCPTPYYDITRTENYVIRGSADFDDNGHVDFADFAVLANAWQSIPGEGDYNEDCNIEYDNAIDISDLILFYEDWLL